MFEIIERTGAGVTGGEITCIEARIQSERKAGFWNGIAYLFCKTRKVAVVWAGGEWCEAGWEHALEACRERRNKI